MDFAYSRSCFVPRSAVESSPVLTTQIHSDPNSGKQTKKKRLGGAYPGQRPPQHQPYTPTEGAFAGGNTATAHFVSYGGGNALVLARPDGSAIPPAQGEKQKEYIQGECLKLISFFRCSCDTNGAQTFIFSHNKNSHAAGRRQGRRYDSRASPFGQNKCHCYSVWIRTWIYLYGRICR